MKKTRFLIIYPLILIGLIIIFATGCKEDSNTQPPLTVTDIDGNVYQTVTIGTQIWMAENLRTTKYRYGDLIGTSEPIDLDLTGLSTQKYQWSYGGIESNATTYGLLYTWYAITDSRNICPSGWHVPADAEWTKLADYIGGVLLAAGKLKEAGFEHWNNPNTEATNDVNFTALPGGFRNLNGSSNNINVSGCWWSLTEYDATNALYRSMSNTSKTFYSDGTNKNIGFSVRCVKD